MTYIILLMIISWIYIVGIALFVILLLIVWKPKGKRGEDYVAALLTSLPDNTYRVINDLMLQSGGHSTQIDHVVVSEYGIFVIETKNYQGWIYGSANNEYWTQNIYGRKYQLRNPLWQNEGHIKALRRVLSEFKCPPFFSIVAFSPQADLRLNDHSIPVMYWRDIVPFINDHKKIQISHTDMISIYFALIAANVSEDKAAQEAHIRSVHQNQTRRDTAVSNGYCPRCGGKLVIRQGRYGPFYGCSNYPKCKYILK